MEPEQKIERLQKALDRDGGHDWPHVVDLLEKGDCQIFDSDQGVWITEIKNAPKGKALNVWLVAGSLPGVMELQPEVEAFAMAVRDADTLARLCARILAGGPHQVHEALELARLVERPAVAKGAGRG